MATLLLSSLALPAAAAEPPSAEARSGTVVNAFRTFCASALPAFASLEAAAQQASNLLVKEETGSPVPATGKGLHTKTWSASAEGGPYTLAVGEARNGTRHVISCTAHTASGSGPAARQDLTTGLGLGNPEHEEPSSDGTRKVIVWKMILETEAVTVMLSHPPSPAGGFDLLLLREPAS